MKVVLCCISLKFVFSGLSEAEVEYITAKLIQSQKENAIMKKYSVQMEKLIIGIIMLKCILNIVRFGVRKMYYLL